MLTKLGVDPRIANNRQIIDSVRDSLFTQYTAAVGPDGALKPADVRTYEQKRSAINRLNGLVMNYTGYDANGVTSSLTDNDIKEMGFNSKEELNKSVTTLMQQKFLQNLDVMNFREKLQNEDKNFILSPEFRKVLSQAEEFDRINGTSGNNSMVTRITGQPNYIEHLDTLAKLMKSPSKEDQQRLDALNEAMDFYTKNQGKGGFNLTGDTYLKDVTTDGLADMKNTVTKLAQINNVTLNETQLNNAVEYFTKVLNDESIPYRNLPKPAYNRSDTIQQSRIKLKMEAYLLATAVNMMAKSK